ncbi:hypothetical protein [Acidipropionibacterium jensenii]|uniref:hypothetical protein n=1 Tax=Acidipropionibacterium jensenii TaxID=1749 RepID=UPI002648BF6E|nr:hypothetical protein [Acidipropionibacterium jensenii]MDN5963022.1 hypothetical protein [Actinomyces sp.]MDN6618027.1 hypothetical protein [Corynebacterium variabile]MDN6442302.1 hypothetical protein [Acidipropionibacterium jensenii]MDN6592017.1 hypothetical protein [Acidipropionibacterium jensenii]MDN6657835.1 hypothetical protein [Acidipropionibacterium jensenii]
MSWFKVDDGFDGSPKALMCSRSAIGLWALAGSWSARYLTDGFVPNVYVTRMDAMADASELVAAGLWEMAEDGGWRFHDWDEFNPRADEVQEKRRKRAEAGKLGGLAKARAQQASSKALANASDVPGERQEHALANACPVPTRPDPTPEPANAGGSRAPKRATQISDSWTPNESNTKKAKEHGLDVEWEADQFRSKALAKGWVYKDWDAAFRNWLGNSAKYAARDGLLKPEGSATSGYHPQASDADVMW